MEGELDRATWETGRGVAGWCICQGSDGRGRAQKTLRRPVLHVDVLTTAEASGEC